MDKKKSKMKKKNKEPRSEPVKTISLSEKVTSVTFKSLFRMKSNVFFTSIIKEKEKKKRDKNKKKNITVPVKQIFDR